MFVVHKNLVSTINLDSLVIRGDQGVLVFLEGHRLNDGQPRPSQRSVKQTLATTAHHTATSCSADT